MLEVTARAITYYLDVSAECTRRIVGVDGAIKALCNRLVVVELNNRTSRDLAEQCVKVGDRQLLQVIRVMSSETVCVCVILVLNWRRDDENWSELSRLRCVFVLLSFGSQPHHRQEIHEHVLLEVY